MRWKIREYLCQIRIYSRKMKIRKYQNKKWLNIDSEKINEYLDELTNEEMKEFALFEVKQFKKGFISNPFVDFELTKPVIDLLTSKYGNKTFCIIDNFQDCGIFSEAYWCLEEDSRYLAYWHFYELEKFINKREYRKREYEKCEILPFSTLNSWNNGHFDTLRLERYLNDLLEQLNNNR